MSEKIRDYWDQRARESKGAASATTNDIHLRKLEHATLIERLNAIVPDGGKVLDIGCGDGLTTLRVAADMPKHEFVGMDYAAGMIENAKVNLSKADEATQGRIRFAQGDATQLGDALGDEKFDVALTGRCLINLDAPEKQYAAVRSIASVLKPGGYYVGIENFMDGQDAMNAARANVDLPPIPVRWHNLFFEKERYLEETKADYSSVEFVDFASSYYFATRVVYSGMCKMKGEDPDYDHEIHQLGPKLPWIGNFSPIRMVVLRKKDA